MVLVIRYEPKMDIIAQKSLTEYPVCFFFIIGRLPVIFLHYETTIYLSNS